MDNSKTPPRQKPRSKKARPDYRWIAMIFVSTMIISGAFSFISGELMQQTGIIVSFVVLFVIVLIGILFDIIGVSVTAANEQPFHSMAARKVPEAPYALRLLRKADRVSTFCNDVIGDICGIISGTAAAAIAVSAVKSAVSTELLIANLVLSAVIAGVTVGGKALGKTFAINNSTVIVQRVAAVLCFFGRIGQYFKKRK